MKALGFRSRSLPQLNCAVLTDLRSKSLSELLDYDITPVFWKSNSTDDLSAEKRLSTSDFELNMPFQQYREYTYPLDCCGHPEENEGNEGVIEEEIELLPSLSVICEDEREMQHSETPQETGEPSTKLKRNSVPPIKFAELLGLKEESLEEGDSLDVQSLLPWDAEGNLRVSKSTENLRLKNSLSLPADISNQQNPQQQEDLDDEDKTPSYYVNLAHGIKEEASPKRFASGAELSETGGKDAQQGTSLDQSVPEESENLISAPQLDRSKSVSTPSISLSGSDICTCSGDGELRDTGGLSEPNPVLRSKLQNAVARKKSSVKHHSALPYMMTSRPIIGAGRSLKNYKFPDSSAPSDSKDVELKSVIQRTPTADMVVMTRAKREDEESAAKKATRRSSHFFPSWTKKPKKQKPHFFIDTSCSNSLLCDLCQKPLANTQALQCNTCEITIHSSCKDQASASCVSQKHPKALRSSTSVKSIDLQVHPKVSLESSQSASDLKLGRPASLVSYLSDVDIAEENPSTPVAVPPEVAPNMPMQFAANLAADPAWMAVGLWIEDAEAWSSTMTKPVLKEMNTKDIKRQDIIHELVVTEKHHCRILVILKQTYWQQLASINIPKSTLDQLFPSLDQLLEIHLHFFRLLRERKSEGPKVEKIHDVIFEQFAGDISPKMQSAYVTFCSNKDQAVQIYNALMRDNVEFRKAIEQIMKVTSYKDKSLPDCLLLVAQRLTKYHVLIEQIRKNTRDETGELQQMESAEKAVKSFLAAIDSGVDQYQLELRRQEICRRFEPKSITRFADKPFGVEQLKLPSRVLLHNVSIIWRSPTKKNENIPVELLLFTDLVVFLFKSGNTYSFLSLDQKASVISLEKLIIREIATNTRLNLGSKSLGLFLIRTQPQPEMYEIYCQNKKDFAKLHQILLLAQERYSKNVTVCRGANVEETEDEIEPEDKSGLSEENMEKILEILQRNISEDDALSVYYERKLRCYQELRDYIESLSPKVKIQVCRQIMEILEENMKEITAAESKTGDLSFWPNWLIFADIYGYAAGCTNNKSPYPRRAETFHGVFDATSKPNRSVKKHPTVTGISDSDSLSVVRHHKSADLVAVSSQKKPSVSDASVTCREITEKMLMRMADLEHSVKRLSSEKTMLDTELSVLKSSKGSRVMKNRRSNDFSAPLEQLRQKESELMRTKIEFDRQMKDKQADLEQKERQIATREAELAKAEAEIFERWKVLRSELPNLPKSPFSGDMNGHSDSVSTADDDQMLSASLSMTPTQLSFASETDGSTLSASGSHSRSQSASRQKEEKSEVKSSPLASQEVKRNGSNATLVPHLLSAVNESRLKDSAGVQPVIQQEIPKNLLSRTSPPKPASMGNSMSFLRSTSFLRNSSVEKKEEKPNGKKIPISTSAGKLQLNNNNLTSPVVTTEGIQQMLPFKLAQEGNKKK